METDPEGTLWLGYDNNHLYSLTHGKVTGYSDPDGLQIGSVTALLPGHPMLVGGELGLNAFDGQRFHPLRFSTPKALTGVTGIVRQKDGTLWLNGKSGAVRIEGGTLRQALTDPDYVMTGRVFGPGDGMPGTAQQVRPLPTLREGADGRLWFAASEGLAWLDPAALTDAPPTNVIRIRSIKTPSQIYSGESGLTLPALTKSVQVGYTALAASPAERAGFKVRLSGIDDDWHNVGSLREVNYSNLHPGPYLLQIRACNSDGICAKTGADLRFSIAFAFYQTRTFEALCALLLVAVLLGLARLSNYRVAARVAARHGERLKERERIARELHDTLLQDVEAMLLNLKVLDERYGDSNPAREELRGVNASATHALQEARHRVTSLRSDTEELLLAETLGDLAEKLGALYPTKAKVRVDGVPVAIQPGAAEELIPIAREAILNAFQHSEATSLEVVIVYRANGIEVVISDNGAGIDQSIIDQGQRPDHWGMVGMRERARKLGGHLSIRSVPGQGTSVRLKVGAHIAFSSRRRKWAIVGALLGKPQLP